MKACVRADVCLCVCLRERVAVCVRQRYYKHAEYCAVRGRVEDLCAAPCYGGASAWLSQVCPALEPRVLRATRRTFSCKGFVCGCARSSIIFPDCAPKWSMAAPPGFQVPAPVPAQSSFSSISISFSISIAQWPSFHLSCGGTDSMHQVICHTALHFRRRACHPPGRPFLSHLTFDGGPRRGEVPGDGRAHRTPLCHRYHSSRETLRFGSCDWDKEILVAS